MHLFICPSCSNKVGLAYHQNIDMLCFPCNLSKFPFQMHIKRCFCLLIICSSHIAFGVRTVIIMGKYGTWHARGNVKKCCIAQNRILQYIFGTMCVSWHIKCWKQLHQLIYKNLIHYVSMATYQAVWWKVGLNDSHSDHTYTRSIQQAQTFKE